MVILVLIASSFALGAGSAVLGYIVWTELKEVERGSEV